MPVCLGPRIAMYQIVSYFPHLAEVIRVADVVSAAGCCFATTIPPIMKISNFSSKGFTLVELLVVIAIVAILVGLLIPGISASKERAKTAKATSDLQQIGAAMFLFASDNEGFFPVSGGTIAYGQTDPQTKKPSWQEQLDPYIEKNRRIFGGANPVPLGDGIYRAAYFNGSRAAYEEAISSGASEGFLLVQQNRIQFSSKYILGGQIGAFRFDEVDADCDNFTQEPAFNGGNLKTPVCLLFADGHLGTFKTFDPDLMMLTYSN